MQRPIMNPIFLDTDEPAPAPRMPLWRRLARLPALLVTALLLDLLFWRRQRRPKIEEGSPLRRLLLAVLYRLAFVPIFVALSSAVLVFAGTHPSRTAAPADPLSSGTYYDPVTFLSKDGTRLDAWLVPALDATRVLAQKEDALRSKFPAVILVHDYACPPQQMLPLVHPLHDAGFVVLVLNLRGSGTSGRAGCTFGIHESADVAAAADMLRRRVYVDDRRIAVVGVGMGASAALLAAERDPSLAALVLDHPSATVEQAVTARIAPPAPALRWMSPLCKWTFELSYGVDADDLDLSAHRKVLASRPVLLLDELTQTSCLDGRGVRQATEFLSKSLAPAPAPTPTAGSEVRMLPPQ